MSKHKMCISGGTDRPAMVLVSSQFGMFTMPPTVADSINVTSILSNILTPISPFLLLIRVAHIKGTRPAILALSDWLLADFVSEIASWRRLITGYFMAYDIR